MEFLLSIAKTFEDRRGAMKANKRGPRCDKRQSSRGDCISTRECRLRILHYFGVRFIACSCICDRTLTHPLPLPFEKKDNKFKCYQVGGQFSSVR